MVFSKLECRFWAAVARVSSVSVESPQEGYWPPALSPSAVPVPPRRSESNGPADFKRRDHYLPHFDRRRHHSTNNSGPRSRMAPAECAMPPLATPPPPPRTAPPPVPPRRAMRGAEGEQRLNPLAPQALINQPIRTPSPTPITGKSMERRKPTYYSRYSICGFLIPHIIATTSILFWLCFRWPICPLRLICILTDPNL